MLDKTTRDKMTLDKMTLDKTALYVPPKLSTLKTIQLKLANEIHFAVTRLSVT
jgi:hypothetical protein